MLWALTGLLLAWAPAAQAQATTHTGTLQAGRASTPAAGQLVVSLDVAGDLPGLLTLDLAVGGDGTIVGGHWAVVAGYVDDSVPEGEVVAATDGDGESHADFVRLVDLGTLSGSVLGGSVGAGPDGSLVLTGVQLALYDGSLTFDSVFSGTGTVDADLGLSSVQGTLQLTF